jgi:ATP-dependent exoDNAse (exonuclease V) alpha subunit
VHERWQAATDAGADALMLARARTDVDALNQRARAAALAVRDVRGPVLAHAGGRDWQAGDILRARCNDRRLPLGDGHVRNGDRFRVLAPGPDGGLVVEHLAGRGRAALPAGYLARHADYGWASTIDGAQGATADIGILLARTGLDREHLYVGMTRGRDANHVHLTTEPVDDDLAHRPQPADPPPTIDDAVRVLQTATARVGAQQAAHTLLDQARDRAHEVAPRRQPAVATRGLDSEREQGRWAASKESSLNWSRRPELASPSSGRSIEI